jgi:hypothetical protein
VAEILSIRSLCTLDDVKGWLPGFTFGIADAADDVLTRCINNATDLVYEYARREFIAENAVAGGVTQLPAGLATIAPQLRTFDVTEDILHWYDEDNFRRLAIGDISAAPTLVTIKDQNGTVVETATSAQYVPVDDLGRRRPKPGRPFRALWFRDDVTVASTLRAGYVVEVTGVWGFPSVPEGARQAAIETAALPYAKDVEKFTATFKVDSRNLVLPRALPDRAKAALKLIGRGAGVG